MTIGKREMRMLVAICLIVVCIVAGIRISSHYRTFGLSYDVISGEETANAEETVRLYLLYLNRNDEDGIQSIETASEYSFPVCEHAFADVILLEIQGIEEADDKEAEFHVRYNYSSFWAKFWKNDFTFDLEFSLIKEDGRWKIDRIGQG